MGARDLEALLAFVDDNEHPYHDVIEKTAYDHIWQACARCWH